METLDLPASTIAGMRASARAADITAARSFGFGGSTWDYAEPSGTGTGPRELTMLGTITGLAFRQAPGPLGRTGVDTPILSDAWRLIVISGPVRPGGVIRSQDDPRYMFTVDSIEPWYDYRRALLQRMRGDITITGDTLGPLEDAAGDVLLGESD